MTRVLVVQRDQAVAEQMAASLRGAGYETELCGGPGREPCPVIEARHRYAALGCPRSTGSYLSSSRLLDL
jgi:CheY-like chemotaxis protein